MERFNVLLFKASREKPLELEGVLVLQMYIGSLKIPVCFGVVNKLAVDKLVGTCFKDRYVHSILATEHGISLKDSWPVYKIAMGRKNDRSLIAIDTDDVCFVTETHPRSEIRVAWRTVIAQTSELAVPAVSAMAGVQLIESKPPAWPREQVIVARGVGIILLLLLFYV